MNSYQFINGTSRKKRKEVIMTNTCEICGCENIATCIYEKEGEVFRMICDFHDKQVNEKKLNPEFKC
jgi:hypothetical protein